MPYSGAGSGPSRADDGGCDEAATGTLRVFRDGGPRTGQAAGCARIAVWTIVNVEEWDIEAPMPRTLLTTPAGVKVIPDVPNWSWHEYGMRIGFWRLMAALDKHNIKATMALNASVCRAYPRLAQAALAAGWEFMGHGYTQKALHSEDDQRAVIRRSIETIREFTGRPPRGWLGQG